MRSYNDHMKVAKDGGHSPAELKGRQETEERGQVEDGDGEDVGKSVAEDGGETAESGGGVGGRVDGRLLLLSDICPQHGPQDPDAEGQTFRTRAEKAADYNMEIVRFPSTDIRHRQKEDIVPEEYKELTRTLVPHFNEFARQKRGGTIEAPEFPVVDYCLFCSVGQCQGGACRGPPRQKEIFPVVCLLSESILFLHLT